jgi:His-Xaa-Ser system radical SAM maturase HxsC
VIPLRLEVTAEAEEPFVTRLRNRACNSQPGDSLLIPTDGEDATFSGQSGLLVFEKLPPEGVDGDVILVSPREGRAERLFRAGSTHNTLLVTERCDQLCVMCSQPPKKTHIDRFKIFEAACLLAPEGAMIGITGGEPTLYKCQLFSLIERTLKARPDVGFHVLTNAQHFDLDDLATLRSEPFRSVVWGIPLYAPEATLHDAIVGKAGAFDRLQSSLHVLLLAGARVELRTVLLQSNAPRFPDLGAYVAHRLRFVEAWSIMQLEHIGFAKNRWDILYFDHRSDFSPVQIALDRTLVGGLNVRLFNFPRCSVPPRYRALAASSISDWKRKFMPDCAGCSEMDRCGGFFEWHPVDHPSARVTPL